MRLNNLTSKIKIESEKIVSKFGWFGGIILLPLFLIAKFLKRLYYLSDRNLKNGYIRYLKKYVPINNNLVVFKSKPDFSDNSRALAEYMIDNGYTDKYTICFDVIDKTVCSRYKDLPIKFFSSSKDNGLNKIKDLRYLYTARYLLSTHEMALPIEKKRKEQLLVRLWHGCGYKDRSQNDNVSTRRFDVALVPGKVFIKTKAYFWNVEEKYIAAKGYPRYNWLLEKDKKTEMFIQELSNNTTKKIIWMPTFRNDKNGKLNDTNKIENFPIIQNKEEWYALDWFCQENNVMLFIKLHPYQKDYDIPFTSFKNIKEIDNKLLSSNNIQLYHFIALTDALISDYSSIAIDYLLVDHPIAFTLDDFETYKNLRGFVFKDPLEFMPGHHLYSFEDLLSFIKDVQNENDKFKDERDKIREITIAKSTDYCRDILDYLGIRK